MAVLDLPYIDREIENLDRGGTPPGYLRHFHWGLFEEGESTAVDDGTERYVAAAEAMTQRVLQVAGVGDGGRLVDVGCGFGGTLELVRARCPSSVLVGVNIDARQLRWGRHLVDPADGEIGFVAGDGCRLPLASASCDRVLAVECVFHFPSRRTFFAEAARVLRPGGVLALTDFLVAPGAMGPVAARVDQLGLGDWYGPSARPLTPAGYDRLGRRCGLELLVDQDVTVRTLPTYAALRRIYREAGADDGVATIEGVERLARGGGWEYHVLAFRRVPSG